MNANHPDLYEDPATLREYLLGRLYHGKSTSLSRLFQKAKLQGRDRADVVWEALHMRWLRRYWNMKGRYERQREHAVNLENLLAEKNAYIRELRDRIDVLEQPDMFAK